VITGRDRVKILRAAALLAVLGGAPALGRAAEAAPADAASARDAAAVREWKEKLGLGADQGAKFLAALKLKDADLQSRREELRGGMRRLQTQLAENAAEKDVLDTLQKLARLRKIIALRNDQFDAETSAFLTPSQRGKLLVWRALSACRGRSAENADGDDLQEPTSGEEVEPE
jgi:hypothetical protein